MSRVVPAAEYVFAFAGAVGTRRAQAYNIFHVPATAATYTNTDTRTTVTNVAKREEVWVD